jgi:hypothetical protein
MVSIPPVTVEPTEISELPLSARRLRDEAWRIRHDAEHITDEKIRRQLLNIAAQYDRLAESRNTDHAEKRALRVHCRQTLTG